MAADELHPPSPVPEWMTRGVLVVCATCGRVLATLALGSTIPTRRWRNIYDLWGLYPAHDQSGATHPGKAMTLVCPHDRRRVTIKASTLGAMVERDTTTTVLRV